MSTPWLLILHCCFGPEGRLYDYVPFIPIPVFYFSYNILQTVNESSLNIDMSISTGITYFSILYSPHCILHISVNHKLGLQHRKASVWDAEDSSYVWICILESCKATFPFTGKCWENVWKIQFHHNHRKSCTHFVSLQQPRTCAAY